MQHGQTITVPCMQVLPEEEEEEEEEEEAPDRALTMIIHLLVVGLLQD